MRTKQTKKNFKEKRKKKMTNWQIILKITIRTKKKKDEKKKK